MSSTYERQPDRETGPSFRVTKDVKNALTGLKNVPCTIKDVARMAGVSTATVSRVTRGGRNVSGKTKTRVLTAVSSLQYSPNALAAELGRRNGGNPRRRGILVPALAGTIARHPTYPGANARNDRRQTGRVLLLEDEYSRVRRLVVKLSKDLEKLRSIIQLREQANLHETK